MTPGSASARSGPVPWAALVPPVIVALVAAAGLVALGVWQLHRLAWKEALIRTVAERTLASPMPLPARATWDGLTPDGYDYRHVVATGTFDHAGEVHVYRPMAFSTGPYAGSGDIVLTPFHLASGGTVLVNRGFVPADRLSPATRAAGQVEGQVTITGIMRAPQTRNAFTPADDPAHDQWFTVDPAEVATVQHIRDAAPFVIDEDAGQAPGGLPQGGETVLDFPNNHLFYALTWFGLAAALVGGTTVWLTRRIRHP